MDISNKNTKIDSSKLLDINAYFIEKNYRINLFEDFFDNLALLLKEPSKLNDKIETLVAELNFKSQDETNEFLKFYISYVNSIKSLFEYFERNEAKNTISALKDIIDGLIQIGDKDFITIGGKVVEEAFYITDLVFKEYSIDKNNPKTLSDDLDKNFDNEINSIFSGIFDLSLKIDGNHNAAIDDIRLLIELIIVLIFNINFLKKLKKEH